MHSPFRAMPAALAEIAYVAFCYWVHLEKHDLCFVLVFVLEFICIVVIWTDVGFEVAMFCR